MSDPATAVFTRRVRPGHEAAYEQLAREVAAAACRDIQELAAAGACRCFSAHTADTDAPDNIAVELLAMKPEASAALYG